MLLQICVLHSGPVAALPSLEPVGSCWVTPGEIGMQGAELGRWGDAAAASQRTWEFSGISSGSVCVCTLREEESGYLKFKAALPSGYCVL